jgi:hypothetical protein
MLFRHRDRVTQRSLAPDVYFTDGRGLFRVVAVLASAGSMLASIEDCLTLETAEYTAAELKTMPLRLVRGSRVDGRTEPRGASVTSVSHAFPVDHDVREVEHDFDRI